MVIEVSWMKVEDQGLRRTLPGLAEPAVQWGRNSWLAITINPTLHLDWVESSTVERRKLSAISQACAHCEVRGSWPIDFRMWIKEYI